MFCNIIYSIAVMGALLGDFIQLVKFLQISLNFKDILGLQEHQLKNMLTFATSRASGEFFTRNYSKEQAHSKYFTIIIKTRA